MRIIARRTLREFRESHPHAEAPLLSWYRTVRQADWDTPMQVKAGFPKADMVGNNHVVFNIRENRYRLIAQIDYRHRIVFVRFVGTHADYNGRPKVVVQTIDDASQGHCRIVVALWNGWRVAGSPSDSSVRPAAGEVHHFQSKGTLDRSRTRT